LVSKIGQACVDNFLDRENSIKTSNKTESDPRTRRKHKMLETQPHYITGGELRDFQLKGLNWLAYNWSLGKNGILADEVGVLFSGALLLDLLIYVSLDGSRKNCPNCCFHELGKSTTPQIKPVAFTKYNFVLHSYAMTEDKMGHSLLLCPYLQYHRGRIRWITGPLR